jgi:hypothetical protein
MRLIVLSTAALLMGAFLVVYGTLLAWRPDLFLKFQKTFIDCGRWNRNAPWRRNLETLATKTAAASFVTFGVFIIYIVLTKLISGQG